MFRVFSIIFFLLIVVADLAINIDKFLSLEKEYEEIVNDTKEKESEQEDKLLRLSDLFNYLVTQHDVSELKQKPLIINNLLPVMPLLEIQVPPPERIS